MVMGEDPVQCRELLLEPIPDASPYAELEPLVEVTVAQRVLEAAEPGIELRELARLLREEAKVI